MPQLVFEDHEHHLLAMTTASVAQPHTCWRDDLLAGRIDAGLLASFGMLLGSLHAVTARNPERYAREFADASFFESLRLEPYYLSTASACPAAAEFLQQLCVDSRAHRQALVHGDYSPKNVLVQAGRLVLLDHEVIHWGDPAFDCGFALTHLISKANHTPRDRPALEAGAVVFWTSYADEVGLGSGGSAGHGNGLEHRCQRHLLGCLLARVDGRSPLAYLSEAARVRQRSVVLGLLPNVPASMPDLIHALCHAFAETHAQHL